MSARQLSVAAAASDRSEKDVCLRHELIEVIQGVILRPVIDAIKQRKLEILAQEWLNANGKTRERVIALVPVRMKIIVRKLGVHPVKDEPIDLSIAYKLIRPAGKLLVLYKVYFSEQGKAPEVCAYIKFV